jgi:hypothetical protein
VLQVALSGGEVRVVEVPEPVVRLGDRARPHQPLADLRGDRVGRHRQRRAAREPRDPGDHEPRACQEGGRARSLYWPPEGRVGRDAHASPSRSNEPASRLSTAQDQE